MIEKRDNPEFQEIAGLIREEKEQALQTFRRGDFEQKVRKQLATVPMGKHKLFEHSMIVPASVAALIVVAGGLTLLFLRRPAAVSQTGPGRMAAILSEWPGISELTLSSEGVPAETTRLSAMAQAVQKVLMLAAKEKEGEEQKSLVPNVLPKVPHLSLEKKMEILLKEKAVERVLVSILEKNKEG
jgi:hypothetical protein